MSPRQIAINGVGNTGLSYLLQWSARLEGGGLSGEVSSSADSPPVLAVLRDPFRSLEEVVFELESGDFGSSPLRFRAEGADVLAAGDHRVRFISSSQPPDWRSLGVTDVIEASGTILSYAENFALHIEGGGATRVVVTAPLEARDSFRAKTLIAGFNESAWSDEDSVFDNGSCTTRATVHVIDAVLAAASGIDHLSFDIVHPKTRGARWALLRSLREGTIRPSNLDVSRRASSAPRMIRKLFPEVELRLSATTLEAPVLDMSFCRLTFVLPQPLTRDVLFSSLKSKEASGRIRIAADGAETDGRYAEEDAIVLFDDAVMLSDRVTSIPVVFDNRWASAAAVRALLEALP